MDPLCFFNRIKFKLCVNNTSYDFEDRCTVAGVANRNVVINFEIVAFEIHKKSADGVGMLPSFYMDIKRDGWF